MDVSGAERVAVEGLEQLASSAYYGGLVRFTFWCGVIFQHTIGRQRVRCGLVAVVPVLAVLVCGELSPQVVWLLVVRVLEIVLSVGTRLPDIDDGVGDALLGV